MEFDAKLHTWDDTHPNPNGEERIAAAFADVLAQRFQIGAKYPRPYPELENIRTELKVAVHVDTAQDAGLGNGQSQTATLPGRDSDLQSVAR
ncbi:hypothetical protein [Streptomyces xanthophaeus]